MSKYEESKGFCMFYDWVEDLSYLAPAEAWELVRALNAYYTEGADPVSLVEGHLKTVAALLFHQIRRQEALSEARTESGRRGGMAKAKNSTAIANDSNAIAVPKQNLATNTNTDTDTNTISLSPPEALSEGEKAELIRQGVPVDYIERQSPRAVVYANREKPLSEVLWEWWQKDRRTPKPRAAPVRSVSENKSYDLDEFWQAALERSLASC